jgi:hypothetical protein
MGTTVLGSATAFVANASGRPFLVTNYHVVSGRRADNGQPVDSQGRIPDRLIVLHNTAILGNWSEKTESLLRPDGSPRWIVHPRRGSTFDVVALELTDTSGCQLYPYDLADLGPDIALAPASDVSIIGFPFGLTAGGGFAIWKTGHVASDLDVDYGNLPVFLVDATTRSGMSGSPVIARRVGAVPMKDGSTAMFAGGPVDRFLGVYSGRLRDGVEIGLIWKAAAVKELLDHAASTR